MKWKYKINNQLPSCKKFKVKERNWKILKNKIHQDKAFKWKKITKMNNKKMNYKKMKKLKIIEKFVFFLLNISIYLYIYR